MRALIENIKIRNCLTATHHCFQSILFCILHSRVEYGMFGAKYVRKEQIGQGAFGKAYKAISKERKGVYIVKEVSGLNKGEIESAKNEVKILKEVHHDNVVKYVDDFAEPGKMLIVMEYCEGGDLGSFIKQQKQPLHEDHVMNWFKQMVSGKDSFIILCVPVCCLCGTNENQSQKVGALIVAF